VNGAYVPDIVYHSQNEVELFLQHAKLLLRERSRGISAFIYLKRQFMYQHATLEMRLEHKRSPLSNSPDNTCYRDEHGSNWYTVLYQFSFCANRFWEKLVSASSVERCENAIKHVGGAGISNSDAVYDEIVGLLRLYLFCDRGACHPLSTCTLQTS
jgi:hypothetical protein